MLARWFALKVHQTTVKREVLAGITTFATMAYMMLVNPLMLSEAGMDFSSAMLAAILTAVFATFLMGCVGNYPFALAPGIGTTAYFAYSVVIGQQVAWQTVLGAVFIAGILLLLLWATGLRAWILNSIPRGLKIATTAGVGLFLVFVGLKNAHIVVAHPSTFVTLGDLKTPEPLLAGLGIVVIAALMARGIRAAILSGILVTWVLALLFQIVTWKGVVAWPNFHTNSFFALDFSQALRIDTWMIALSFLFISLFDVAGSLTGLAHQGHFFNKNGELPRLQRTLLPDALGTTAGALFGTAPCAIYAESAAGIATGGRTGLTACVAAFLFLCALFFQPLAFSIPLFAITPVLVVVGALMMRTLVHLDWEEPSDFIPCFVTVVGIPLTYSIATGIGLGLIFYPLCKLFAGKEKDVSLVTWALALLFALKFAL